MTDPKIIPLQPDQTQNEIDGGHAPLTPPGEVKIVPLAGNPDETVDLPGYVDIDGVEEGDKVEEENK